MVDVKIKSTNFLAKQYKKAEVNIDEQKDYPCLKLITKHEIKVINISKACKVFHTFSKNKIACKLFMAKKVICFSCSDRDEITKLERKINEILFNYHKKSSIQNINILISDKPQKETSSIQEINILISDKLQIEEITEEDLKSSTPEIFVNTLENENMSHFESIFQMNYTIPTYDGNSEAFDKYNKIGFDIPGKIDADLLKNAIRILELRQQILHPGGVKVEINKTALNRFSVKDRDEKLWISKVKDSDEKLYFGDRIIKIFNKEINSELEFRENIKENDFHLIIQRLPNAKVFIYEKNKFKNSIIQLKKKNYYLFKHDNLSNENWVITELNGFNALDISKNLTTLCALLESSPTYLTLIIHPEEFVNSLTGK